MSVTNKQDPCQTSPDHRRGNFSRSPSIGEIIKLNTYLCYQSFFILPSILTWLKTSQTVLQSYAEKCTTTIKSAFYNTILYKIIDAQLKVVAATLGDVSLWEPWKIIPAVGIVLIEMRRNLEDLEFKRKILKVIVYFTFCFVFVQLFACLLVLSVGFVPPGLVFLVVSLAMICYANYQCMRFVIVKEILKEEEKISKNSHVSRRYVKPKHILGKRTISNVDLF